MTENINKTGSPDFKSGFDTEQLELSRMQTSRLEERVNQLKTQTEDQDNRAIAGVFDRFWDEILDIPEFGKLNLSLQVKDNAGVVAMHSLDKSQVLAPDRTHPVWKGTVVDSGTNEASVIVTKTLSGNGTERTVVKVSPFNYRTEDGNKACKLKPDALIKNAPGTKGAMFRNKQEF